MNQARIPSVPSLRPRNLMARWLVLAGVVGPIVYVAALGLSWPHRQGITRIGQQLRIDPIHTDSRSRHPGTP